MLLFLGPKIRPWTMFLYHLEYLLFVPIQKVAWAGQALYICTYLCVLMVV